MHPIFEGIVDILDPVYEELEPFPTEEAESELDKPYSEYQVGSIVKIIDLDEDYTEWAAFEIVECRLHTHFYDSTDTYLNQAQWYFRLANLNGNEIFKSLWIAENEICDFDMAHNVCT